ncbi:hypothetical protein BaRGS_00023697 [Batillaria attramentaria]|uniref:Uncharacterized protein n=1 Tax=Batillaria attramentaria TaxID=370345 RepID=A0ABD0KD87_9CAEN
MDAWRRRSTRRMTPRKTRQSASLRKPIKAKKAAPPEAGQYATTNVDTGLVEYTAHPEDSCLQSYWAKEGDTEGKDCCKKSSDTQVKIHCSFENPSEAEAEAGAAGSASEEPATEANTESPTPENPIEIKVNFVE